MNKVNAVTVLREAARLYSRHAATVVGLSAAIQVGYVVLSILFMDLLGPGGLILSQFLSVVATQVTIGVLTLLVVQLRYNPEPPPAGALLKAVLPRALSLWGLAFVVGLRAGIGWLAGFLVGGLAGAAIGGETGAMLGALLLGVSLATFFYVTSAVAAPALIAGRMRVGEAIRTSTGLVKPQFASVFVVVLLQGAITVIGVIASRHVAADDGAFEDIFLAQAFVTAIIAPLTALALAQLFLELTEGASSGAPVDAPTSRAVAPAGAWVPQVPVAAPAPAPTWSPAAAQQPAYGAQPGYGAAPAQPAYGAQPAYAAQQPAYGAAPAHPPYGAQPAYAAAPAQPAYAAAPPAPGYEAQPAYPAQQPYAAAPAQYPPQAAPAAYGAPPTHQAAYGTPAAAAPQAYGAPAHGGPQGPVNDRSQSVAPPGFG